MRIHRYDEVDSTNERALLAVGAGGALEGDVHVAVRQTLGRGRRGRAWVSTAGEGLYLSYVHRPAPPPPRAEVVTVAAGLALLDAVRALGAADARLDWPNDLVHGEAKLAGILVEARGQDPSAPHFVCGFGLNVRQERFPAELEAERAVTSLRRVGLDADVAHAERELLTALPGRLTQARSDRAGLLTEYLEAARLAGREVALTTGQGSWTGVVGGIDEELRLALLPGPGEERRFPLAHVLALDPRP